MGFGTVIFTDGAVRSCACDIEIAQGAVFQPVCLVTPFEHMLHDQLALAVRIGGDLTVVFLDGDALRFAKGSGGGGKYKVGNLVFDHGFNQGKTGRYVVAEICFRNIHALADKREGRKVDDGFNGLLLEDVLKEFLVGHAAHIKPSTF